MQALEDRDFFTDYEILKEPYAYFEAVRKHGPVYQPPGKDYLIVTGYDEALEVLKNHHDFSAVIGVQGAAAALPFRPEGSDITAQVEAHRMQFLGGDMLVNYDDQQHSNSRALLSRLFTPSRLKANERFIDKLSDDLAREMVTRGGCELINDVATPFVTHVIADLLGVPFEDRLVFMDAIAAAPPPGSLDGNNDHSAEAHPLVVMGGYFIKYVQDRRANPRDDVLSELSNAKFPDGGTPDAAEIVRLSTFLFGAGQDTSAKLLGNAMRHLVEVPGLQDKLRKDPTLIPAFLEEVLRLEGSTKQTARLARRDSSIAGIPVKAGTKILLALSAGNRDAKRWEDPEALVLDRPRIKEHIAFGRGKHVCAGAPLARVEVRVMFEKFLKYTSNIELDDTQHGPKGARNLEYEPSFIIRGLAALKLKLTPAPDFAPNPPGTPPVFEPRSNRPVAAKVDSGRLSTTDTTIGALLDNDAAKAVLDKHFPGMSSDPRIAMGKAMTLRQVQAFASDQFSNEQLDAVDADLAKLTLH